MIFLFLSIAVFLIIVIVHILLHRFLLRYKIVTFRSLSVFIPGFFLDLGVVAYLYANSAVNNSEIFSIPLPITAVILYVLLSLNFAVFMTSVYLQDQSPSTKLIWLITVNPGIGFTQIKRHFSNQEMIYKRLVDLVNSDWIKKRNSKYGIKPRGKMIMKCIYFYRNLLGWKLSG